MGVCSHVFHYFVGRKSERVNEAILRQRGSISGRGERFSRFQILVVLLLRMIGFIPPFLPYDFMAFAGTSINLPYADMRSSLTVELCTELPPFYPDECQWSFLTAPTSR